MCFSGLKILSVQYIDDEYLYLIIENSIDPLMFAETLKINKETMRIGENVLKYAGLYSFNLGHLIKNKKFETYKISESVTGTATKLNYS